MKDNRIEKIKQHYTIILNNKRYKVLKHKIDSEKSLLTIKTKVFGQNFPHGENISFVTAEDSDSTLIVAWKGMWKDEKEYCVRQFHHNFVTETAIQHPTCFVPKSLYNKFGCFDEHYRVCADFELLNRFTLL